MKKNISDSAKAKIEREELMESIKNPVITGDNVDELV